MGLFSSSSKSSNTSNTNEFGLTGVDNRVIEGPVQTVGGNINLGSGGAMESVSITQTDHGAVAGALDLAEVAFEDLQELNSAYLASSGESSKQAIQSVQEIATATANQGQAVVAESLIKVFLPFLMGLLLLGGFVVFKGGR